MSDEIPPAVKQTKVVRIIDADDPHHRRLGFVMGEGEGWYDVWIGDHPADFRHRVTHDQTQPIEGRWHPGPDGGTVFIVEGSEN